MRIRSRAAALSTAFLLLLAPALAAQSPVAAHRERHALVVSQSPLASAAGVAALRAGGNAVDAAVATAFVLAVTHPAAGNIGGGGFLVVRTPEGESTCFDFRERAPLGSYAEMFRGAGGAYDPRVHHWSLRAVGVPGSVAGLHASHRELGRLPWRDVVAPAVELAARGFRVSPALARSLRSVHEDLIRHPATRAQFTRDGAPLEPGDLLVQTDLARTLERIRDEGPAGFYRGETAALIVSEMERGGGLIGFDDLESYRAVERRPIRGTYRGHEIISMPPPSSGGIALVTMLNILEGTDVAAAGLRSAREVHWIAEAMRRAFADRARYVGDPDQVEVPVDRLVSKEHAAALRRSIDESRASRSAPASFPWPAEGEQTTHLSVVDASRMCVSLTTTLEDSYGVRVVVSGAGFLLNNEMGDFNAGAGLTTEQGLIGTAPNLVAPGKRMLSSMTPTIVTRDGRPVLVVGSPGGRTIINSVLLVILDHLDHRLPIQEAVDCGRFHHQWLPDRITAERHAFSPDTASRLRELGHELVEREDGQGSVMAIALAPDGTLEAGVDRRQGDGSAAGY